MADAASPDTPTDPQPNPIAGRTEADGPLFEYGLRVFYPNDGGRVTESGWTTAAKLAQRLRDEADQIEHIAGLLSLSGDTTDAVDPDVLEVLEYVSRGRNYVDVTPYPDFNARRALGRMHDEGSLRSGASGAPAKTEEVPRP